MSRSEASKISGMVQIPPVPRTGINHTWEGILTEADKGKILKVKIPNGFEQPLKFGDTINNDFVFLGYSKVYTDLVLVHAEKQGGENK